MSNKKLLNKKKLQISALSLLAGGLILGGTYAYFSDTGVKTLEGSRIGTVSISTKAEIAHEDGLNNVNPGDNDKTVPAKNRKGTDHEFYITVTNTGTKSIMARNLIEIKILNEENNPINFNTQDRGSAVLITKAGEKDDKDPIGDSSIQAPNRGLVGNPMEGSFNPENTVYTIVDTPYALNGSVEKEVAAEEKNSLTYAYDLGLIKELKDEYAGYTIEITVGAQAMQYRNTGDDEWNTLFEEKLTIPVD